MAKDMRSSKTGAAQASAADLYQFMKRVWPYLAAILAVPKAAPPRLVWLFVVADAAATSTHCKASATAISNTSLLAEVFFDCAHAWLLP